MLLWLAVTGHGQLSSVQRILLGALLAVVFT
jgi:hypothetical protein